MAIPIRVNREARLVVKKEIEREKGEKRENEGGKIKVKGKQGTETGESKVEPRVRTPFKTLPVVK